MPWACDRCGTLHTQNPDECRSCGHRIFEPVTATEASGRSEGIDEPDAMEIDGDRVMGAAGEPEYDSSPDVAVDGSVASESTHQSQKTHRTSGPGTPRSVYNQLRAILLAPVGLLRQYFWALLAFGVVFGVALYLVL
jgi:predicted  nucleic acid-binding Zn-ribbon protein